MLTLVLQRNQNTIMLLSDPEGRFTNVLWRTEKRRMLQKRKAVSMQSMK